MPPKGTVRCRVGGGELGEEVDRLFGAGALRALAGYVPMYCWSSFTEVYLLREELLEAVDRVLSSGRVPYSAGLYAGRLRRSRPRFIPSHLLVERVYEALGRYVRALEASEQGVRVVLYGRDLLRVSTLRCFEPVERGEVVSVVGTDGRVYALGLSEVDSCSELERLRAEDVVARVIFDLGWYLRGGTVARERKYRV
jgi:ribosome biogenesis protein Nip4